MKVDDLKTARILFRPIQAVSIREDVLNDHPTLRQCCLTGVPGFPLHPAGKPSDTWAKHLFDVHVPTLFIQGTRNKLAESQLLEQRLGKCASLHHVQDADHSFHVPAGFGRNGELIDTLSAWIGATAG
jgi:hypothetical protein